MKGSWVPAGSQGPGVLVPLLHHTLTFVSSEEHPRIYIEVNCWGIIATKILLFINEYNYFIFYSPIGCKILLFSVRSPRRSWYFFSAFSWVFFEMENPFSLDNHLRHLLIKCYHHYLGVNNSFLKPCLFAFAMYAAPSGYLRRYLHHFSLPKHDYRHLYWKLLKFQCCFWGLIYSGFLGLLGIS